MSFISIVIIALAVAMDAFAVAVSSGIAIKRMRIQHALLIASFFGVFQGIMPFLGWLIGEELKLLISGWDHWIAFILLAIIGIKMIYESFHTTEQEQPRNPLNIYVLFILSIATSIDALAVGLTLSFTDVGIALPSIVIGVITFVTSFAGTYIGAACGHFLESKVERVAGILLILIGAHILLQHTGIL